jgi:hypothetical protein
MISRIDSDSFDELDRRYVNICDNFYGIAFIGWQSFSHWLTRLRTLGLDRDPLFSILGRFFVKE